MAHVAEKLTEEITKEHRYPCHMCKHGSMHHFDADDFNRYCTKCTRKDSHDKPSKFIPAEFF